MNMHNHRQSILKSLIWRIMGVVILGAVTYAFTHSWFITTLVALIHHATFLLVFYLHERIWVKVRIEGKKRNIIKALVYEIILGMGIGGLIVYLVTGSFPLVTQITGTYTAIKLVTYFIYDRMYPEV